jgi:hypothetical protein
MSVIQIEELEAGSDELEATDVEAFLKWMEEVRSSVPPEVWEELPTDLAENFDHYAYGTKRSA